MLAVVGIIALGGAADPATGRPGTELWANWHLVGSLLGLLFIGWTYVAAWNNVAAQHAIIEQLVTQVEQARRQHGITQSEGESSGSGRIDQSPSAVAG
jgi:hypothetical protein